MTNTITIDPAIEAIATSRRQLGSKPVTITLQDAAANAKQAVAAIEAEQPTAAPRITLAARWAQFLTNRRIAKLKAQIASQQERIASLPGMAAECKRKAQVAYGAELKNIDLWHQAEFTAAKIAINSAQADLAMLGDKA